MTSGANKLLEDFEKIDGTDYGDGPRDPDDEIEDDEEEGGDDDDGGPDDVDDDPDLVAAQPQAREPKAPKEKKAKAAEPEPPQIRRLPNGIHVDQHGNIVDPRDGTIIAKAGSDRRLYEKNLRTSSVLDETQKENTKLKEQLADHTYLEGVPKKYNLQTDEVQTALALAAVYKQNPVEAARNMVEMVLALGHNVTDILGNDAGNALEMNAVKQMLDERLAPITGAAQQHTQRESQQKEAERQLAAFVNDHEHSGVHLTVLDRMMGENPDLSPEKAYYELKLFCARRGLDFSQPLQPQLIALAQQQQDGTQQRPARRRASLPNGRQSVDAQRPMADTLQADPNQSWSDIIKSSM